MENLVELINRLNKGEFKSLSDQFTDLTCQVARKVCNLMLDLKVKKIGGYTLKECHNGDQEVTYLFFVHPDGYDCNLEIDRNGWWGCESMMIAANDAERIKFLHDVPAILRVLAMVDKKKSAEYRQLVYLANEININL